MKRKPIIFVNPNSSKSEKVIDYLQKNDLAFYSKPHFTKIKPFIKDQVDRGNNNFIVCGGDGSINKFINALMKLPKEKRKKIILSIIPCGEANDFARYLNIPFNIKKAFKATEKNKIKKIDVIKINTHYLITGGGIGLPTEVMEDIDKFSGSWCGKIIKKRIGDLFYLGSIIKKFLLGYKGVFYKDNKLLAICILNQPCIGKVLNFMPGAKSDDGYVDVGSIKVPPTFLSHLITLSKVTKGQLEKLEWVTTEKTKKLKIKLREPTYFFGDGEFLEKNTKFNIKVIPKAINIRC